MCLRPKRPPPDASPACNPAAALDQAPTLAALQAAWARLAPLYAAAGPIERARLEQRHARRYLALALAP